jgi:hypothetical protein
MARCKTPASRSTSVIHAAVMSSIVFGCFMFGLVLLRGNALGETGQAGRTAGHESPFAKPKTVETWRQFFSRISPGRKGDGSRLIDVPHRRD